jgi:hypothetical protein
MQNELKPAVAVIAQSDDRVQVAVSILVAAARIAHHAPNAALTEFNFRIRPDLTGVDCFRGWTGVVLPFAKLPA